MSSTRPTALVTGASAGIGRAFAGILAQRGFDLVLTARREHRLRALAADLRSRHAITVDTFPVDLTDSTAPARLIAHVRSGGRRIDMLVNNAGFALPGAYSASTWQEHDRFIRVLVSAQCELAHLVLPAMIGRRSGYIVNVASIEALRPGSAFNTLYAAAKSFMVQFSRSLHAEVATHGIHVTALCPGYTRTEFHDVSGKQIWATDVPEFMWMTADDVARHGYEAVMRNKAVHVPGRINRNLIFISKLLPDDWTPLVRRVQARAFRLLSAGTLKSALGR